MFELHKANICGKARKMYQVLKNLSCWLFDKIDLFLMPIKEKVKSYNYLLKKYYKDNFSKKSTIYRKK